MGPAPLALPRLRKAAETQRLTPQSLKAVPSVAGRAREPRRIRVVRVCVPWSGEGSLCLPKAASTSRSRRLPEWPAPPRAGVCGGTPPLPPRRQRRHTQLWGHSLLARALPASHSSSQRPELFRVDPTWSLSTRGARCQWLLPWPAPPAGTCVPRHGLAWL